jgi:hypothetical protein
VIITGLTSKVTCTSNFEEKKKWFSTIVNDLLKKLDKDLDFMNQGKNNGRDIPMESEIQRQRVGIKNQKGICSKNQSWGGF